MTNLYSITQLSTHGSNFSAEIIFNAAHQVFSGHFPGQPIVPGVVLVEISAAVVSQITGKELIVKEASVIKFLQVIDPLQNPLVMINGSVTEEEDKYKVELNFFSGETVFVKIKGLKLSPA